MSTVRDLSNRLLRTMLTPPDKQGIQVSIVVPIGAIDATIALGDFTVAEDAALMRQGSILEADEELMRVIGYDPSTHVVEVLRAQYSTTPVEHEMPLFINMNPSYPMQSIFEAIRDNIIQLYPRLSSMRTVTPTREPDHSSFQGSYVWSIDDPRAVSVVETFIRGSKTAIDLDARIVDIDGVKVLVTNGRASDIDVRYRRNMAMATSMDDELYDLGLEEVWAVVVMIGAAADLVAGRDIPAAETDWIGKALEAENIRVGTRASLSVGLARYRELLIDRFSREQKGQETSKPKVHIADPFAQVPGL